MSGCSWLPIASPPNPRLVEKGDLPHVFRRPSGGWQRTCDRPLEIVNSLKEKRVQDPILKFRANNKNLRDLYGKDTSHKKIERRVKGEDYLSGDSDPREYIMGPEEGWKPERKNMRRQDKNKQKKQNTGYVNPTGRKGSKDPVPPPVIPMPYIPLEDIVWCPDDEEWDQLPDITADEVLAILTAMKPCHEICRLCVDGLVDERMPRGIDLTKIETSYKEQTVNIERSGHCSVFDGILDSSVSLKVVVSNDYHKCEAWAEEVLSKRPTHMGIEMFAGFINDLLPNPHKDTFESPLTKPKDSKMATTPAPLPIQGPLQLSDDDKNIYAMCLTTDETALVVQLAQMRVVGPKLRAVLESETTKVGQHSAQYISLLRKDGLEMNSTGDVTQAFLMMFENSTIRKKVGEVCRRAGHFTWLKSLSGVEIEEPFQLYPYMWGDLDYSDEMVEYAVRRAFANLVVLTITDEISPSDLVGLQPKPEESIPEKSDPNSEGNEHYGAHPDDESSYQQSSIQEYGKKTQPFTELATQ